VAGHRDTLFRCLRGVAKDDLILFRTLGGSYAYRVDNIQIVRPQDVRVLQPSESSELTLITCHPFSYFGAAPDRFVVKARQVYQPPPGI
jgi:sortase A